MLVYVGTAVSVLTVTMSAYALLAQETDIERVITFATIGLFTGTILLLGDRITKIRLPVLGEVVAKARQDANEIKVMRDDVLRQSKMIEGVLEQAANLQQDIDDVSNALQGQKIATKKRFLEDKITTLRAELDELQQAQTKLITRGSLSTMEGSQDYTEILTKIGHLSEQLAQYSNELEALDSATEDTQAR